MPCGTTSGVYKYRYWVKIGTYSWMEVFLNQEARITYKRERKRVYYRATSSVWKIARYLNVAAYDDIVTYVASFYTCPEIKLKITNNTGDYWLGRTAVNLIKINLDHGVIEIESTPDDDYNWIDDYGDEQPYLTGTDSVTVQIGQVPDVKNVSSEKLISNVFTAGSKSILTSILAEFSSITTVSSDFFTAAVNPVLGGTNCWNNIRVVRYGSILGTAALGGGYYITFNELMDLLFDRFYTYFYIDGTTIYLKHDSEITRTVGIDLTDTVTYPLKHQTIYDINGNETDNEYEYDNTKLPKSEILKTWECFGGTYTPEYNAYIDYRDYNTVTKNGSDTFGKDEYIVDTDNFAEIWGSGGEIPGKGMIIMALDGANQIQNAALWSGGTASNGYMYYRNLVNYFWRHSRPFSNMKYVENATGQRGILAATPPLRKVKKQRKVRFPVVAAFDPDNLIKTNLGDGEIETAVHELDTDFMDVELIYTA